MQSFIMKISFHSYANKTNFHKKIIALSFAFTLRFTGTRKWLILFSYLTPEILVLPVFGLVGLGVGGVVIGGFVVVRGTVKEEQIHFTITL